MSLRLFAAAALSTAVAHPTWEEFKLTYNKFYNGDDEERRESIYDASLAIIDEHNARNLGSRLGVNQFADLTKDEFKKAYLSGLTGAESDWNVAEVGLTAPDSVDWVKLGAVTAVKDQGSCGSCWAFSTTGAIEGAWFLYSGSLLDLSEEELMDCSGKNGNKGCRGGEPTNSFKYVEASGICSNASYPYNTLTSQCLAKWPFSCDAVAHIDGYRTIQRYNELALKAALALQPISVEIDASEDVFRLYESGVISADTCGTLLDHAVLAVGYGTDATGHDFWRVKNSWGATWGDGGYVNIARTDSTRSYGACGIAQQASYPVINSASIQV